MADWYEISTPTEPHFSSSVSIYTSDEAYTTDPIYLKRPEISE